MKVSMWLEYEPIKGGSLSHEEVLQILMISSSSLEDVITINEGDEAREIKMVKGKCWPFDSPEVMLTNS